MLEKHTLPAEFRLFQEGLIAEIREIVSTREKQKLQKWIRSKEVQQLLGISRGALHTLRKKKILCPARIGGTYYYDRDHIIALLRANS